MLGLHKMKRGISDTKPFEGPCLTRSYDPVSPVHAVIIQNLGLQGLGFRALDFSRVSLWGLGLKL